MTGGAAAAGAVVAGVAAVGTDDIGAVAVGAAEVPLDVAGGSVDWAWIGRGVSEKVRRAASAIVGTFARDRQRRSVARKVFRDRFISTDFLLRRRFGSIARRARGDCTSEWSNVLAFRIKQASEREF